ncbi:MAG: SRPBCC domain-containing protein [Bryobacteraceae bacterium]|nr:SRPBCC domain-containing protein [Bryobacteraceae bacterium]
MPTTPAEQVIQTLEVTKDELIAAPIDIVFETILEQMGPQNETPDGTPLKMTLEPWPGGRWFRDLGNNSGHFWGHVQSIKPPALLEIHGPMFMSSPAISHLLYRMTEENGGTRIRFSHRAVGQIEPEYLDGVQINEGWSHLFSRLRQTAERRTKEMK